MPYNLRSRKIALPINDAEQAAPPRKKLKEAVVKIQPEKEVKEKKVKEKVVKEKVVKEKEVKEKEVKEKDVKEKDVKEKDVKEKEVKETKVPVAKKVEDKIPKEEKPKGDFVRVQLVFGADSCGELGLGKIGIQRKIPTKVPIQEQVKAIACGPMHTLTLTDDGKVYTYGCNDEGALGRVTDGDEELEAKPTIVPLEAKGVKITAGDSHSAVLTDTHQVIIWGNFRDEHGSVGLTTSCDGKPSYKPILLLPDKKFSDIASGSNHMLLLDTDGKVYSFGVGAQGQLGRLKPDESALKITAENRDTFLNPQEVSMKDVDKGRAFVCDAVYAGNFSSFATNTDKKKNRLAAWGLNNYFQLGYKGQKGQLIQHYARRSTFTCSTSMVGVACGQHHTLFLTRTGRVYSAGRHDYGMLGLGKKSKEVCPAAYVESLPPTLAIGAGINTSFAVTTEGQLFSWGMSGSSLGIDTEDDLMAPTEVKNLEGKKVVAVSAGGSFTSVLVE